jgi:hypothetical protein
MPSPLPQSLCTCCSFSSSTFFRYPHMAHAVLQLSLEMPTSHHSIWINSLKTQHFILCTPLYFFIFLSGTTSVIVSPIVYVPLIKKQLSRAGTLFCTLLLCLQHLEQCCPEKLFNKCLLNEWNAIGNHWRVLSRKDMRLSWVCLKKLMSCLPCSCDTFQQFPLHFNCPSV